MCSCSMHTARQQVQCMFSNPASAMLQPCRATVPRRMHFPTTGSSNSKCCSVHLWSRQPDDWDRHWQAEEDARHQQMRQQGLVNNAQQQAAWRQQVDYVHQQLLDQQKHKAALRERLQQDAQRAKREQLRRIEPVAKAKARANGLASLGMDPQISALSEKFGRLSHLVDEVQQRMEAHYGLMGSMDDAAAYSGQLPAPGGAAVQQQFAMGWGAGGTYADQQASYLPQQIVVNHQLQQQQQQVPSHWQQTPQQQHIVPQQLWQQHNRGQCSGDQ